MQAELPGKCDDFPAGHISQVVSDVAAYSIENLPMMHKSHSIGPASFLYDPATHSTQGPPFGPECPGIHVHPLIVELPGKELEPEGHDKQVAFEKEPATDEKVSGGHSRQEDDPAASLYVPMVQGSHGPRSGPL